jgi:hypothetical protein
VIQMHKDVTVNETEYRVGRMKAHVGAWIISLLRGKTQASAARRGAEPVGEVEPIVEEKELSGEEKRKRFEEGLMATTVYLIGQFSFDEMRQVQDLCLEQCARYEEIGGKAVPMPILAGPGRWAISELEYDGPTVLSLTRECLAFNIAPFFTGSR